MEVGGVEFIPAVDAEEAEAGDDLVFKDTEHADEALAAAGGRGDALEAADADGASAQDLSLGERRGSTRPGAEGVGLRGGGVQARCG